MRKVTVLKSIPMEEEALRCPKVIEEWTNRINNELNENLRLLHPNDAKTITTKLRQLGPSPQAEHVFRETVIGAYFTRCGYGPRYEQKIDNQTPDWVLSTSPFEAVVDVLNIEPVALVRGGWQREVTFTGDRGDSLWPRIREKAVKYRDLVTRKDSAFLIAICPHFGASIQEADVVEVLYDINSGIFRDSPHLSGCLLVESLSTRGAERYVDHWVHKYAENPIANVPWLHLP